MRNVFHLYSFILVFMFSYNLWLMTPNDSNRFRQIFSRWYSHCARKVKINKITFSRLDSHHLQCWANCKATYSKAKVLLALRMCSCDKQDATMATAIALHLLSASAWSRRSSVWGVKLSTSPKLRCKCDVQQHPSRSSERKLKTRQQCKHQELATALCLLAEACGENLFFTRFLACQDGGPAPRHKPRLTQSRPRRLEDSGSPCISDLPLSTADLSADLWSWMLATPLL